MTVENVIEGVLDAVKMHGTYTMHDKGMHEIYDVEPIAAHVMSLSGEDAHKFLISLLEAPQLRADAIATAMLTSVIECCDDDGTMSDEWWENAIEADSRLSNLY